jgi:4-aminobutyrate aminotransferase-like enzyme
MLLQVLESFTPELRANIREQGAYFQEGLRKVQRANPDAVQDVTGTASLNSDHDHIKNCESDRLVTFLLKTLRNLLILLILLKLRHYYDNCTNFVHTRHRFTRRVSSP